MAPRECGLSFPPDHVVCGGHIFGDVLERTESWEELAMETR